MSQYKSFAVTNTIPAVADAFVVIVVLVTVLVEYCKITKAENETIENIMTVHLDCSRIGTKERDTFNQVLNVGNYCFFY